MKTSHRRPRNIKKQKAAKGAFDTRPQACAVGMKGLVDTTPPPLDFIIDPFSRTILDPGPT